MPRRSKRLRTGAEGEEDLMTQAASQDEVLSGPPNDGPCPAFLKFLECHVVLDQLMQFLKLEEMKVLILVSKGMLAAVLGTIEFSKRSQFHIDRDLRCLDLQSYLPFKWKHMAFDVSLPMRVVNQFADKLKFVESLVLHYNYTYREDDPSEPGKLIPTNIIEDCSRIQEILSISTNLRELQLDVFLMKYPLSEMFSSGKVQQSMRNLESLIVNGRGPLRLNSLDLTQFQRNMLQLSRCSFTKLRRFSIKDMFDKECDSVTEIIKAFKETLEVLELNQDIWRLEEMKGLRCPKLKKLFAGIYEDELKDVAEFVEKQPLLEELLLELSSSTFMSTEDLKCFQGRLQNLRKFQYCVELHYKPGKEFIAIDWTFLESMTKLEEFTVGSPFGGRGPEMIDRIPASIKKLNLKCGWKEQEFWPINAVSLDIGNHLKRLKNLTHLSLFLCSEVLRDVGLQTIIKTLPNLMVLKFSSCAKLTDFGISGVSRNASVRGCEPGVPLSDLKGLVELEIYCCDLLTEPCILRVVRFECLRKFIFRTSEEHKKQEKNAFESRIKKQNPRLTFLQRNCNSWTKNGQVWTYEFW